MKILVTGALGFSHLIEELLGRFADWYRSYYDV